MPPTRTPRIPKYRLHKPKGLGVVRLNGRDIYLGKYGKPESQAEYRRVIAEWLAAGGTTPTRPAGGVDGVAGRSINELVLGYIRFAKGYYVKNGRPTGELNNIKDAVKPLVLSHGHLDVAEFGPISLKAVRDCMIAANLSRGVVNERVNRIRRVFKWGVENQLVPPQVLQGLQAVGPLKRGRCEARETEPVRPVPDEIVDAVIAVAPPQIAAMIQLQRLTGMRPGEVVRMRTCDLDMTGAVWVYTPFEHKTQHHGRSRVIHLGPNAQSVLRPHLRTDLAAFIFSPREVQDLRRRDARARRVTPITPSQAARGRKPEPERAPGCRYTTTSYARAITYACDLAFPHPAFATHSRKTLTPEQLSELDAWRRGRRFSPNQLRHNAATKLRRQFGIEAARVVLGHSSAGVTEIYAERDLGQAARIMGQVG